jgi:UDP-GlcNAc:undecaprenyl-phosphate GlcNAc-1-phosphate transferase
MAELPFAFGASFLEAIGAGSYLPVNSLPESFLPWLGGGSAFVAALVLTPLVLRAARWGGWIAHPSADRWHDRPVALLGGIALFGAVAVGVVGGGALTAYTAPVWGGAILIFAVGLADDLLDVRPEAKLIAQVGATALLLYAGHGFWRGGPFWMSIPLTFLWVIGITNAVNLIDGLDGLAASITAVAATALAVLGGAIGQIGLAAVAATLAGTSLGFLIYNAKPARIFMGDCGSMFLGYMLAVVALGAQSTGEPVVSTLVPVVVLAVPIFDTTFVTVTRILEGRSVIEGGNDHTHHRLVRLGLSEQGAVLSLSGVSAVFASAALALLWSTAQLFMALLLLGVVGSVVFGFYLVGSHS